MTEEVEAKAEKKPAKKAAPKAKSKDPVDFEDVSQYEGKQVPLAVANANKIKAIKHNQKVARRASEAARKAMLSELS